MPYIRQDVLNEAVLFKLFQLAQTSAGQFARPRLVEEFSIEIGEKRIGLACEELDEKGLVSYLPPRASISRKGYNHVEKSLIDQDSIIYALQQFGDDWLGQQTIGSAFVPAADRIVTRQDNGPSIEEIESEIEAVVDELSQNNEVGDALGDERDMIVGEVSAARELVKSSRFNLGRLIQLVTPALKFLAEKFSGAAIGEAAKHLLTLIMALF